ncbi:Stress-activated map kinase-interacting protein 1 [Eumeta japonica]|uniref:Stress-activated map kinase-interacting protein 1 n=1 Tax=Eumeta variegata TaxID=151549 RepID=A0A4C1UN17_EUMVA|nr:Stress-activated map kinase-interacting protein 1 [Eumeta japonica]
MATYDNKYWLLNNIRNSFITEDKTLTCEEILGGDDFAEKCYQKLLKKSNGSEVFSSYHPYTYDKDNQDDDADLVYSFQIRPHDYMVLQWSNENVQTFTAHHNNTKTVEWRDPEPCTKNEDAILFPKKRLSILKDKDIEKKSLLAELLQNETELKQLRYQKYARFDGTGVVGVSTLNFKIFLKMGLDNMISTDVCIMSGTIYMDLIGLACYKFCLDNPNIILQSVNSYTLSVVDEDGEIFWGFSCLNPKSYCTEKYGHNLCLVENSATSKDTEAIEDKAGTSVTTVDSIEVQCRQGKV